jgi:hypothetical protein
MGAKWRPYPRDQGKFIAIRDGANLTEVFGSNSNTPWEARFRHAMTLPFYQAHPDQLERIEDNFDMPTIYKILDTSAGININGKSEEPVKNQAEKSGETWETLDLAKLEAEVFLLGIWKDYQELETCMSMPELMVTLEVVRELDYTEKKFLAAIQGVDLDGDKNKGQKEWEDMKARVFSGGQTGDSNDVLALQGVNAQKAGFGIGQGLDYEDLRN